MQEHASIVIVTCNRLQFTQQSLESIFSHSDYPYELLILDNGSTDGTVEYLQDIEKQPEIKEIIYFPENRGKPAAANHGFTLATGDFIIGLDDDVIVPEGWLSTLIGALKTIPNVGWLAINLENFTNQPDHFRAEYEHKFDDYIVQETPGVAGFCVAMNRSTYEQLGGYIEGTFYGIEDGDYLIRSRKAGLLSGYLMNVVGLHLGGTPREAELYPEYMEYKYQTHREFLKGNDTLTTTDFYTERIKLFQPEILQQGQLIKSEQPAVYFVYNGKKHLIPSIEVFEHLGFEWENVISVSQTEIEQLPEGIILQI